MRCLSREQVAGIGLATLVAIFPVAAVAWHFLGLQGSPIHEGCEDVAVFDLLQTIPTLHGTTEALRTHVYSLQLALAVAWVVMRARFGAGYLVPLLVVLVPLRGLLHSAHSTCQAREPPVTETVVDALLRPSAMGDTAWRGYAFDSFLAWNAALIRSLWVVRYTSRWPRAGLIACGALVLFYSCAVRSPATDSVILSLIVAWLVSDQRPTDAEAYLELARVTVKRQVAPPTEPAAPVFSIEDQEDEVNEREEDGKEENDEKEELVAV